MSAMDIYDGLFQDPTPKPVDDPHLVVVVESRVSDKRKKVCTMYRNGQQGVLPDKHDLL